jgi:23S rRNA G2069 N7-methylase RlmK/C1962 C5-methylase RlmI
LVELAEAYGRLIARAAPLLDPGGLLLVGANALTIDDARLAALIAEARERSGSTLAIAERLGPGADFPPAPERPVARFVLLRG